MGASLTPALPGIAALTGAPHLSTRVQTADPGLLSERALLSVVRNAVTAGDEVATADILKYGLFELARTGQLAAIRYPAARADRYARRLVYSDPWSRFVIIAMTWAAGQYTPLHDHAGVWCVEVVVDGDMEVTNYELLHETPSGRCRFARRQTIAAPPASSGALIPPFEHHTFGNVGSAPSHTLHVYGGPMNRCDIFALVPGESGGWQRTHRELRYDD